MRCIKNVEVVSPRSQVPQLNSPTSGFELGGDFRQQVWIGFTWTDDIEQPHDRGCKSAFARKVAGVVLSVELGKPVQIPWCCDNGVVLAMRLKRGLVNRSATHEKEPAVLRTTRQQVDGSIYVRRECACRILLTLGDVVNRGKMEDRIWAKPSNFRFDGFCVQQVDFYELHASKIWRLDPLTPKAKRIENQDVVFSDKLAT